MAFFSQQKKARIQPKIKELCKQYGLKGSLSIRHSSTVVLTIHSGPLDFNLGERDHKLVSDYWMEKNYSGETLEFLRKAFAILNTGNHDRSDMMTDYHDVGHYIEIRIGRWDKPYVLEARQARAA